MQSRLEQRFVGVDVADAGHDALIEQHRLQTARGRRQTLAPVGGVEAERLRPQAGGRERRFNFFLGAKQRGAAEAADVAETQLPLVVVEVEDQMRVVLCRARRRPPPSTAGHAQVDDEPAAVVQFQQRSICRGAERPRRAGRRGVFQAAFHGLRRARRPAHTLVKRRPTSSGRKSRTTVSTSGSSGMATSDDAFSNLSAIIRRSPGGAPHRFPP